MNNPDIVSHIGSFLDLCELVLCQRVSKTFLSALRRPSLYERFGAEDFACLNKHISKLCPVEINILLKRTPNPRIQELKKLSLSCDTRLRKEVRECEIGSLSGCVLQPERYCAHQWKCKIMGRGVYEGGMFELKIWVSSDYPFKPPNVKFLTPIYHPNITCGDEGKVCLGILQESWSPALSLSRVVLAIQALLADPNLNDAVVCPEIAKEYKNDRETFDKKAMEMTKLHASF